MSVIVKFLSKTKWTLCHPLASNSVLLATSQYIAAGLGFITTIMAARLLGPTNYGVAALVMAYPTLLWSFVSVKSMSVTTRYIAALRTTARKEELKGICKLGYSLDFLVSLVALVLVSATGWWVAAVIYKMPHLFWLMIVYAASFPFFSLIGTSWAILSSWNQFRRLAIFQVIDRAIGLVLVIGFLLSGFGVTGMIIAISLGQALIGIAMMLTATCVLYRDGLGIWWKGTLRSVVPLRKELVTFFGWNYLIVTLSGLVGQVPLMLLGQLRGPEEAGYYRLATSIMTIGSYLESSLGRVAYPLLSARWSAGELESLKRSLKRWTLHGGIPVGTLVLLAIPFLPIIVPLVFGHGYSTMVPGVQVMMVAVAVSAVFFWLSSFYYSLGKIALWAKAYTLYVVLVIGLSFLVIQQWGFFGLAGLVAGGKVLFTICLGIPTVASGRDFR